MRDDKEAYYRTKEKGNLKEYIFMTESGYRHFFALGVDLKDAEKNFMASDETQRAFFGLDDLPIRLEYDKEKCHDWVMSDYWANNENLDYRFRKSEATIE